MEKVIVYLEMLNITQYYGFEYLKYVKINKKSKKSVDTGLSKCYYIQVAGKRQHLEN